jgi:hypothetical protein
MAGILRGIFPTNKVSSGTDVSLNRNKEAVCACLQPSHEKLVTRFMSASSSNVTHSRESIRTTNEIGVAQTRVRQIVAGRRRKKNAQ